MAKPPTTRPGDAPPLKDKASDPRKARLASALRANLKRRKAASPPKPPER